MKNQQKWIWQHPNYPKFQYNIHELLPKITQIAQNIGQVKALISLLDADAQNSIKIDLFTSEIVSTSAIEGEHLSRESVRSSIRKKLDSAFDKAHDTSTYHTDALADILIDTLLNAADLNLKRLHKWHIALLSHTPSIFANIQLGKFREYDDMQIVSGPIGKEKVHYVGLPFKKIDKDVNLLLEYIDKSQDDIYIKSAIAHLWFVTIHPYDDGNGRMARIISDYVVSKNFGLEYKYFSISTAIAKDRKNYYDKLEMTQNLIHNPNLDCTMWIKWYLDRFNDSLQETLDAIKRIMSKTNFWDKVRHITLNQRQLKVLSKLLEYNEGEFQGGLTTKKYVAMTKTSLATAKRDIQELLKHKCLYQLEGTQGRNIKYDIAY
jgi:Fic family protein